MDEDAKKKFLEAYQPKPIKVLKAEPQANQARFSPCGKYILAAGFDSLVRRWDVSAEEMPELATLEGHGGWVQALAFDAKRKEVFSVDSWGQLRAGSYEGKKPAARWMVSAAHDGWIQDVAVSPDGQQLATCGNDLRVRVWSTAEGKLLQEFSGHEQVVYRIAFHPSGKFLVSGDQLGIARQWDLATGKQVREFDASMLYFLHRDQDIGGVRTLIFSADGKTLALGGTQPKNSGNVTGTPTLLLFDWATGKQSHKMELSTTTGVYIHDAYLSPHNFVIAVTSGQSGTGQLIIQRPEDKEPLYFDRNMVNSHSLSISPDGRRLAIAATNRGSNVNGRRLNKDGTYVANNTPIHILDLPTSVL